MRTIIVDDEINAREGLKEILENYFPKIEVITMAENVKSAISVINEYQPELVFLDIKMPDGTGFDVLEQISVVNCEIIFVTAYDEFAIKAFQFSAFGYLLKPIKIKELRSYVEKIEEHLEEVKLNSKRTKILVENYEAGEGKIKKLVVPNMTGFDVLEIKNILRLEGDKNYTRFISEDKHPVLVSKTLKTYEELLSEHGFIRIHQSTIINLRHVARYIKGDGGEVVMSDGVNVKVARNRKEELLKKFM